MPRRPPEDAPTAERRIRRRDALGAALSALVWACGGDDAPFAGPADAGPDAPADPSLLARHTFVGEAPFSVTKVGRGLDARKRLDLGDINTTTTDVGADAFFVRTEAPDGLPPNEPAFLALGGLVSQSLSIPMGELVRDARPMGTHLLECSGNTRDGAFGLLSVTSWEGVLVADLLAKVSSTDPGARVLVSGRDDHSAPSEGGHSQKGASWIFSRADLVRAGAFLATKMGDRPLTRDHGAPARLVVPGWYGCTAIKWVDTITLVPDDAPATDHMKEFALRTHQHYAFDLAREYSPAALEVSAVCTRAETRLVDGKPRLRLRGLVWGGTSVTTLLRLFLDEGGGDPVTVRAPAPHPTTWGVWEWTGPVLGPGRHTVRLRAEPIEVPQRRLKSGHYTRTFEVSG